MNLKDCPFCDLKINDPGRIVSESEFSFVIRDAFPVTAGHSLVIPKRHVSDYFMLTQSEIDTTQLHIKEQKKFLEINDPSISGFNIGINIGEAAGQTIFHCHIHIIPRRLGDVENPRGGVRHVIPGKGSYLESGE